MERAFNKRRLAIPLSDVFELFLNCTVLTCSGSWKYGNMTIESSGFREVLHHLSDSLILLQEHYLFRLSQIKSPVLFEKTNAKIDLSLNYLYLPSSLKKLNGKNSEVNIVVVQFFFQI